MDGQLREILREERYEAHQLAEDEGAAPHVERVVDAEGVKHGGQQHVLPNERGEAGALEVGLEEGVAEIVPHELDQHVHREDQVDGGEGERWYDPGQVGGPTVHQDMDEAYVKEGVCSGDIAHEKLDYVPLVEVKQFFILQQPLNIDDDIDFPDASKEQVYAVDIE